MPNSTPRQDPTYSARGYQEMVGGMVTGRVAYAILEAFLRARLHWPGQRSQQMDISLAPDRLAARIGFEPAEVAQALLDLAQRGAITLHPSAIFVTDPDRLVDAASADPAEMLSRLRKWRWPNCRAAPSGAPFVSKSNPD